MMTRTALFTLLTVLFLALGFSACGGDDTDPPTTDGSIATTDGEIDDPATDSGLPPTTDGKTPDHKCKLPHEAFASLYKQYNYTLFLNIFHAEPFARVSVNSNGKEICADETDLEGHAQFTCKDVIKMLPIEKVVIMFSRPSACISASMEIMVGAKF